MVKLKILFVCVMMMSLFVRGVAQQAVSRRICDTIHYEFIHDKIIIPVTVNGVTVKVYRGYGRNDRDDTGSGR